MADNDTVNTSLSDAVLTVTLNRPKVLNSMTLPMMSALREALAGAATDAVSGKVRAVVITGAGAGFCAGADLAEALGGSTEPIDLGKLLRDGFNPVIEDIRSLPMPVIAAVNGVAAGAGMSFAMACDIVLASDSGRFCQVFARIGVIPDAGSTWFLPRIVGDMRARALTMLTDMISAADAQRLGLVWDVVGDLELENHAHAMAMRLAKQPTRAFALTKQALEASGVNTLAEQLELEATLQQQAGQTVDHREGVKAFLEKRQAVFVGR